MTFTEVLIILESRGEKIIHDRIHSIQTDKFIYSREANGEWIQKELPIVTMVIEPYLPLDPTISVKNKKKK